MVEDQSLYSRFERFVARLFSLHDFISQPTDRGRGPDLLLRNGDELLAVEIKFYRSTRMSRSLLISAAKQAFVGAHRFSATPCLVVSNVLENEIRRSLVGEFGLAMYDYNDLFSLIGDNPGLIEEFQGLLREGYQFEAGPLPTPIDTGATATPTERSKLSRPAEPKSNEGAKISASVRAVKPGKVGFAKFEERGIEALQFLFKEDLVEWRKQSTTNSGLHRFDASARIASSHSFWLTLVEQFRTRNVVFEFKNYAEAITQQQIYSTEKYLYPSALRSTAIILSRNGAAKNAQEAARGALRETGKLILILNLKQLCDMLKAKDAGDSPSDILGQMLDEMLIRLDR